MLFRSVRELAFRLMESAQWDRLENLLDATKSSPALANDTLKREFAQLRNIAAFARGDAGVAWPVAWCKPGTGSREVTAEWQWNIKDIAPDRNDFDTATSVAAKPLLPEINGQQSVEIFFGEMPADLKLIGKVEGTAAQGSVSVTLPVANGFLRAVAVFENKRIKGPLSVMNSGRRVYPPEGTSMKDLLLSGPEPLASALITEAGTAPDGSPALRLGNPQERRRLSFAGPNFPVTPGKFYVERAWVRRTGTGSVMVSSEFTPIKTSKAGSLNMLLTDQMEATGQWVLHTRATPALDQHTFWIPMDEIAGMTPRLWDMDPGTEIAGFELLEIDGWKYADWLTELVLLRKNAGENPDAATLDRAIALASIEPLTAMDYQGDWLGKLLPTAGRENQLLDLFRAAFSAEANPLFSRPKIPRIFDYLLGVLNRGEGTAGFRENLALLALESPARTSPTQRLAFLFHAITLATTPEKKAVLSQATSEELTKKLRDESDGKGFLKSALATRIGRDERPANELLRLLVTLNDPATSALFLETIQGKPKDGVALNDPSGTAALSLKNQEKRTDGLELSDRIFAAIALEAAMPNAAAGTNWSEEISRAFRATEKSNSPETCLRWPCVLADFLASRNLASDIVTALREQSLQRALAAKPEDAGRTAEAIRAAVFLIENRLDQKAGTQETVTVLLPILQVASGKLSESSLRLLLQAVNRLAESGANEQAAALVRAAEPDIRRFPKMTEDFARHLPTEPKAP